MSAWYPETQLCTSAMDLHYAPPVCTSVMHPNTHPMLIPNIRGCKVWKLSTLLDYMMNKNWFFSSYDIESHRRVLKFCTLHCRSNFFKWSKWLNYYFYLAHIIIGPMVKKSAQSFARFSQSYQELLLVVFRIYIVMLLRPK